MADDEPYIVIPDIVKQMQTLLETLSPMREMILGYRQQYIDAGVNATDADHIAAALHAVVMKGITDAQDDDKKA